MRCIALKQNTKKILSYLLVAAIASAVTFGLTLFFWGGSTKLEELEFLISDYYIDEVNYTEIEDAAAIAMVDALSDRWSYYIPASQMEAFTEESQNEYVGIGITIYQHFDGRGIEVATVTPGSSAEEAGFQAGDLITAIEGQSTLEMTTTEARNLVRGKEGTTVSITLTRGSREWTLDVTRRVIQVVVAEGQMLPDQIGLVTIANFDGRCAQETISCIENLVDAGAKALIFDVRNNPGGFAEEMIQILDHLLPEGPLFRTLDYSGAETVDSSDADHLAIPMAVLVNQDSYSAAEFFAAALSEYDWAVTVGEQTVGKGYYQITTPLTDGSAVNLSMGKYFTPNGVSLADVGGLTPDVTVEIDDETAFNIYAGLLPPGEDPQVLAAMEELMAD